MTNLTLGSHNTKQQLHFSPQFSISETLEACDTSEYG